MAQRSRFFDSISGDRIYTSADFALHFARLLLRDGVVASLDGDLQATPTAPESMGVKVASGSAWVQGYGFEVFSAAETLSLAASDPTNPRIDRVVVRLDRSSPVRSVALAVLTGTPAPSPAAPALTRDATTWELSLAAVTVPAGASTIVAGNIADERSDETVCGYSVPTWLHAGPNAIWPAAAGGASLGTAALPWGDLHLSGLLQGTGLVPPANRQFKGALVLKSATQSIPGSATTPLTWQVEQYDTDGFFTTGQPTRLTVPAGVIRVRLSAGLTFTASFTELTVMQILRNGATFNGAPVIRNNGNAGDGINLSTPVLDVVPGDYWEATILQGNATAKDVSASGNTWFALEVIQ